MTEPRQFQCLNCALLTSCNETDEDKIKNQYVCSRWERADPAIVQARNSAIQMFGIEGLRAARNTQDH